MEDGKVKTQRECELEVLLAQEKEMNDSLREERDRAIGAEQAKSLFFSTVSHDVRTTLNSIVGYTELLRLGIADTFERNKALDAIKTSGQELLKLIDNVLDLSTLESSETKLETESTDCARLFRDTLDTFKAEALRKGIELVADIKPMPRLEIDPQRVRRILFNLLANSLKFTDNGSVKVSAEYTGETLSFSVADTGRGISEEDQVKIASPDIRFVGKDRRGGQGLGLAICKQLVFKMNGAIELASAIGAGTTFKVDLPGVKSCGGIGAVPEPFAKSFQIKSANQSPRVLLVDDMPINLAVVKALLGRLGIRDVVTAVDGCDALVKLEGADNSSAHADAFDAVLTDLWMPKLDGDGLVRAIRRTARLSSLPVYAITADVEAQKNFEERGFDGVLIKPVTLDKLKGVLG